MNAGMASVPQIYHRTKEVNIYPAEVDRFLIEAILHDEVHDVHAEVQILHPSLEIVTARSEIRNGPFTNVCNMTHPNIEKLVGMKNTCLSYDERNEAIIEEKTKPLRLREQRMPTREMD
ncbi:MAG: DUF2889 domain-containing protein [Candidatus Binatia bacterium]|nr:DUF2889 domain-containing protein [Candidatus Binatia bacterium]